MAKKKAKYGNKANEEVGEAIHKFKEGKQRSGKKSKAKSRKQAIAIGLSKARKQGGKVPKKSSKKANSKGATSKKVSSKKASSEKASSKKRSSKKSTQKKSTQKRSKKS